MCSCLCHVALRDKHVATQVGVKADERFTRGDVQQLQRGIVLLLVQSHGGQAQNRKHSQFLGRRIVLRPLQPLRRRFQISRVTLGLGKNECRHGAIGRTRVLGNDLVAHVSNLVHVALCHGLFEFDELQRRLLHLCALVMFPSLCASDADHECDGRRDHQAAVVAPERLERIDLFLLFQVINCHC